MSYFGTSGPKSNFAHSIAAGYARRSNLNNARKTSAFGSLGNTVKTTEKGIFESSRDRLNDAYNKRFAAKYGDVSELLTKVEAWRTHEAEVVDMRRTNLQLASDRVSKAATNKVTLIEEHAKILPEWNLATSGNIEDANTEVMNAGINTIKKIFPTYQVSNYDKLLAEQTKIIQNLLADREKRRIELRDATLVLDRVYMKDVEDWMVDGRLMRESKTALIVTPTMLLLGAGVAIYFGAFKESLKAPKATANKGAAFAVFS